MPKNMDQETESKKEIEFYLNEGKLINQKMFVEGIVCVNK